MARTPSRRRRPSGRAVLAAALVVAVGATVAAIALPRSAAAVRSARPVWAFLPGWDPAGLSSLRAHASQVGVVLPTGLSLSPAGAVRGRPAHGSVALARSLGIGVQPVLANSSPSGFDGRRADLLLRDPARRAVAVRQLAALAVQGGWDGVNVDLEALPIRDRTALVTFVRELGAALGPARTVSVDVPAQASAAYDLAGLARAADRVLLMAYDQNASAGSPGPIAAPSFVQVQVRRTLQLVPPQKLVLGVPAYGYDWSGSQPPQALSLAGALEAARRSGTMPVWSRQGGAAHFSYDRAGTRHTVWVADALSLASTLRLAPPGGTVAIWRLGTEDPGIWPVLASRSPGRALASRLGTIPAPAQVAVTGSGDVIRATSGATGRRAVTPGLDSETFSILPRPWRINRMTAGDKRVAITFDDGPSAQWTPQILAELQRLHVPATFFLVGENAARYPDLVASEAAAGMILANHTFSHPDVTATAAWRTRLQIDVTQRLIAGITGRQPRLFRAPYAADASPSLPSQVGPLLTAQQLGLTVVDASVDSQDYLRPGVAKIVANVLAGLSAGNGNIVLFHDGGGDRSQTLAALPIVVKELRARGYNIVSVPALLGQPPAQVMPKVGGGQLWLSRAVAWTLEGWFAATGWIARISIGLLTLLGLRAAVLAFLAVRHRRRSEEPPAGPAPSVTILVPAYNEAAVIGRTVTSLLAQVGVRPEILVIDDGSSDGTAEAAAAAAEGVTVLRQENAGKWAALNSGLLAATGDVVVAIDADTQLDPYAVARLVRWFVDPGVGAVSGNAKVGNRRNLVTLWQHVEYVTGFNLDRRAYSSLNAITVVPGAIGAWRRSALLELGAYSGRTLAEDCDLTITLRRAGWRILYEPAAIAWTEVPETLRGLVRQRMRWTFGTLQALWAHRDALLRPREGALGMVALPYAWLYVIVLSVLAPAIDLMILVSLLSGGFALALWWFLAATGVEMGVAFLAFRLERERAWPVLTLPLQRFVYRQLLYVTVLRSLLRALGGRVLRWGSVARRGTVQTTPGGRP